MGVRLYPNTKDAAKLEKLAGVPAGTMRQLRIWQEMQKMYCEAKGIQDSRELLDNCSPGPDIRYDFYAISCGSDVDRLETFLLNGWGKFSYKIPGQEECGEVGPGREAVLMFMSSNAADISDIDTTDSLAVFDLVVMAEGVHWG